MSGPEKESQSPLSSDPVTPIAIIGIGCRFPGARGPEALWRIIIENRCTVSEVPEHRIELGYSVDRYYDPRPRIPGRISSCKAGFIDHPERFDPLPFGLTPRDAAALEPQARMMLEAVWDAIEDAGIPFEDLRGERVGVLVGHTYEDFSRERIAVLGEDAAMRSLDVRTAVGYARSAISGRISHQLDLRGPSLTIDTACSSSLYATHLACQSLWRGESTLAFAGGVSLFLTPEGSLALSRSGMMANDGRCKAFDAKADGFVRAEGAGVVLLRPLADAVANGDPIYAVIRGTGVSADGRDGGHMMAPGRSGQVQAMRDAYRTAGLAASEIDFVEAHGTGTWIGDPVEIAALGDVMCEGRAADRPLLISSIKGNIGHAESASGAAGLIRAALAIERRVVPAQLHFETPNPQIAWDEVPIVVQREATPWPERDVARAAVNSFGISGTNAHVVLESAPALDECVESSFDGPLLLPITAHDSNALSELASLHLEQLRETAWVDDEETKPQAKAIRGPIALTDLGYTLARRRSHHSERLSIVADSPAALALELEAYLAGTPSPACQSGRARAGGPGPLVFVFPGQGGQWAGMGADLLDRSSAFRTSIEASDAAYRKHVDWSLVDVLRDSLRDGGPFERLSVLQPVLVAVQIALADMLADCGIVPDAVMGQSVGEIAAAAVAGVFPREEIARLVCLRGAAVEHAAGKGAMGLIALSEDETREAIASAGDRLEVAGQNGPASTLIAGDRDPLISMIKRLEARGVFARTLDVDFASHCFHMDPLLEAFSAELGALAPNEASCSIYSTVEGDVISGPALGTDYWLRNLRQRVRFSDAMMRALEPAESTFVELSPHPTLGTPIGEIAAVLGKTARTFATLRRGQPGQESMLRLLGSLFTTGHPVDMKRLYPQGRNVRLPLYPYQKRTLWFGSRRRPRQSAPIHPLLGKRSHDAAAPRHQRWETLIDLDTTQAFGLAERDDLTALPAGFCIEVALAAAADVWPDCGARVTRMRLPTDPPLRGADGTAESRFVLQVNFVAGAEGSGRLNLYTRNLEDSGAAWRHAAAAEVSTLADDNQDDAFGEQREDLAQIRKRIATEVAPEWSKAVLARAGAGFARRVDGLRTLHLGKDELLARIEIPTACQNDIGHYHLHPVLIETGIALAGCVLEPPEGGPFARGLSSLTCFARCEESNWCHAKLAADGRSIDLSFYSESGKRLAEIEGLRTRPGASPGRASAERFIHQIAWSPVKDTVEPGRNGGNDAVFPNRSERWIVAAADATEARLQARALGSRCLAIANLEAGHIKRLAETGDAPGLLLLAYDFANDFFWSPAEVGVGTTPFARLLDCLAAEDTTLGEVVVVTRGVHRDDKPSALTEQASAIAWGIATTEGQRADAKGPRYSAIDLPSDPSVNDATTVARFLAERGDGPAYAFVVDRWLEPKLVQSALSDNRQVAAGSDACFAAQLEPQAYGESCVVLRAREVAQPKPFEVTVRVHAAGLSQLDTRAALGLGEDLQALDSTRAAATKLGLGRECAGNIVAVGNCVTEFRVGDAVVGLAQGAVASHVTTPAAWLSPLPDGFTFAAGAALPLAHVVAERALLDLARVTPGERVLVLAGAGGVGLAITQVARRLGAHVLAASSTERRRSALKASGAELTCDVSGSAIVSAARAWVEDGGVDVVLCAFDDSRIEQASETLAASGRFIDLRPAGARTCSSPMLRGNQTLFSFDFDRWLAETPETVGAALRRAIKNIDHAVRNGAQPAPHNTFSIAELARALRFAEQDRQIGRITIDLTSEEPLSIQVGPSSQLLSDELRHWISGARAQDIEMQAKWLMERGARALLVCPTRPLGEHEAPLLERLEALGLRVELVSGNKAGASLELSRDVHPLGSVIHVVDDTISSATAIDAEIELMRVLDTATRDQPPKVFLLVHAARDVFGRGHEDKSPGAEGEHSQGRIDAGRGMRTFADALCRERRRRGQPAASIGIAYTGEGAPSSERRIGQAMGLLVFCERGGQGGLGDDGVVIPADPEDWPTQGARSLLHETSLSAGSTSAIYSPIDLAGLPPEQRTARLAAVVEERIANVLALSGEARARLDPNASLVDLGLDSLLARELALLIEKDAGIALPPATWVDRPSLHVLLESLEKAVALKATIH
ncbi:MAG: acyltransferase domain-containing protein [Myxococcales bacterium]|nr:acyltransferase domain-containing protein [Myxococcales bacterium]